MTLDSAARRFYQRGHDAQLRPSVPQELSVENGMRLLESKGHRYHCVYAELSRAPARHACELGFGGPDLVPALASLTSSYTIVDIVDRYSGAKAPANVRFVLSDLNDDFPFDDGQFDAVVAMMVVEHLFDPFHSFKEITRICRPKGKIFVNLPNIASIKCRWALLQGRMPVTSSPDWFEKREWDGNHLHNFTIADTLRLADFSGLKPEAIFPVGRALSIKKIRPSLFSHEVSFCFSRP